MIRCETIYDLLPLYAEGICSVQSRELIERHIESCAVCGNELTKMQSGEIKIRFSGGDDEKISVLKSMKKKIIRKNICVALTAGITAIFFAFGGFWYVFQYETPMKYVQGMIWTQWIDAESYLENDGAYETFSGLYIATSKDYYKKYAASRLISVNGVDTEIVYFNFTETLSTRWWPKYNGEQYNSIGGVSKHVPYPAGIVNYPSLPMELYYVNTSLDKFDSMSDDEFYAQRNNGVLLWSGTIDPK
jgi:hypothetical protein